MEKDKPKKDILPEDFIERLEKDYDMPREEFTKAITGYGKEDLKRIIKEEEEKVKEGLPELESFFVAEFVGAKPKFVTKLLGDHIMKKFRFKTIKGNDRQIYFYNEGYYKENGIALIKEYATKSLRDRFKIHYIYEILDYIRNLSYISAEEINNEWINLRNGLLNATTKELKEHTPDIFTLRQLPIVYDPEAKCDLWQEKLKEKCDEEWKFDLTQEMFGYCLLKDQRFEKAFLLYGDPRTMKSTALYVLSQLLGEKNITAMSLQYLTEDRHGPAFLYGNPANICADLSSKELRSTAMFMKIIGQDSITAGKKFEQEITFIPFTKLIFSCNTIPATTNKNMAFYRRWVILEYNIQTPENEINVLMREELLKELSGILNWALEGTERILKNNKLSYPLSDEETKDLYERGSDSINSFIYNEIDMEDDEGAVKKREVYKAYAKYCRKNRLHVDNQIIFGRRFFAITGCGTKRLGVIPSYAGVSFKHAQTNTPKNEEPQESQENKKVPQREL